ncbi:uncharacterized protein (TIGR02099 family) [Litorivivens lipolytica]|uniref:Uncharacterized protein (TIGR02099 family) n=1 Tax=Litorivivens lipolytica TaxID=1524264 RepID=A0A7W4W449_9GAMM|nr:YhdP family protein [Litorivivens lipolytica]MBB3047121.1 uncharacterized protein (TIGR02099 family) [Litorivivens lipolytica]
MTLISRLFRILYRSCWALAVSVLVLLALYASAGRYFIEFLPDYSDELVTLVKERAGADLSLERPIAGWTGLSPILDVQSLDLSRDGLPAVTLTGAHVKLGLISGLITRGSVDVLELRADQVDLHLHEDDAGKWTFAGQPLVGSEPANLDLTSILMGIREAEVKAVSVVLHYASGDDAHLWGQRLRLAGDSGFRRLKAGLGIEGSRPTRLIVELNGDPRDTDFQLDAYLKLENSSFSTLAPLLGYYQPLAELEGNGELWFALNGDRQARWQGRLEVPKLSLGKLWESHQDVTSAGLNFAGRVIDGQARTWFSQLDFYWEEQYVDWSGLQLSFAPEAADRLRIVLPSLDFALTQKRLINSGAIPVNLAEVLADLAPQGRIKNLQVDIPLADPKTARLSGELSAVVLESWRNAPSVRGLSGYIEANASGGELTIDSNRFLLGLPSVYENPLELASLATRLQWQITEDVLRIRSGLIQARDGDSRVGGKISLTLPLKANSAIEPEMALLVGLSDADVSQREQYLPSALGDGLKQWMDESIVRGRIESAGFLFSGSLKNPDERRIQLALDGRGFALEYHPDWPGLAKADVDLLLDGDEVTVRAESAQIYKDIVLSDIDVAIGLDKTDDVWLAVKAKAAAPLPSALRVVRESALRNQVGSTFDEWAGRGSVEAVLDLNIPLTPNREPVARVHANIDAKQVELQNLRLKLEDLRGPLVFDSSTGLNGRDIQATVFGKAAQINVIQNPGKPVLVNAKGRADVTSVRDWLQQPLIGFAQGEAAYNVDISVGEDRAHLKASSDLFGVAIDLPHPLGKPMQESRLLELDIPLNRQPLEIDVTIDRLGRLLLGFDDSQAFSGGSFAIGNHSIPPPPRGLFMVVGELPSADLNAWLAVMDRFQRMGSKEGGQPLPIVVENVKVEAFDALGNVWESVLLNAHNGIEGRSPWQFLIAAPRLEGKVIVPADGPLQIDLVRLQLPSAPSPAEGEKVSLLANVQPSLLPELDFSVQQLTVGDAHWGSLAFAMRRREQGVLLQDLRGNIRGLRLGEGRPMELEWLRTEAGDSTRLNGRLAVADIGSVLQSWDFERVMESRSGEAELALSWPDTPDLFSPNIVSGSTSLSFNNGRFLRGSDAASGTLRMVGLLNFANVIRRLQFDFKDIFEKGIHYDRIRGRMQFDDGLMRLPGGMEIEGPSSTFKISGSLDFNTDLTDMELLATLPLGSNLPWVAAFVAGLPAAAGVYIASKVFEEQVDKASTLVYSVKGPWQNPELEFVRMFGEEAEKGDAERKKMRGAGGR